MGVFGKSFAEISEGAKLLKTINKDSSSLGNWFKSIKDISNVNGVLITKDEANTISQYYSAMKSGTSASRAWGENIKNCRSEVKGLANDVRTGAVSINEIDKAANKSSTAMKGLSTVASMAGNMILSMGISLAIGEAISIITELSQVEENRRKLAIENANHSKEEIDSIVNLHNAYTTANIEYKNGIGSKENLTNTTNELLSALGLEYSQVQELASGYKSLDDTINNLTIDALKTKLSDLYKGYTAASSNFTDSVNDNIGTTATNYRGSINGITLLKDENDELTNFLINESKLSENLYDNGYYYVDMSKFDLDTVEGAIDAYNYLSDVLKEVEENQSKLGMTPEQIAQNSWYQKISGIVSEIEKSNTDFFEFRKNINETISQIYYQDYVNRNGIPETIDEYNMLKDTILETIIANKSFVGSESEIKDAVLNTLSSVSELSDYTNLEDLFDQKQELNSSFNFNDIKKAVDEYKNLGNELSKLSTESPTSPLSNIVKNTKENGKELAEYAQSFGLTTDELINSYDKFQKQFSNDDEVSKWYNNLSTYNKGLVFDISLRSDNSALWSLERWQEELHQVDNVGKTTEEQMESLNVILEDTSDEGFTAGVKKDIASIDKLREAIKSVSGMSQEDRISLAMDMPQLLPYISDTELFKKKLNELYDSSKKGLDDRLQSQIDGLKETAPVAAEVLEHIKTSLDNLYNTSFDFDITDEISSFNDLWTAMSESASATGLTADSMSKLKNRYGELADFKPNELFEKTANGIHLNVNALRNLEKAYDEQKRDELNSQLKSLVDQYEGLSREINKTTDASKKAELVAQQNYLQNEIDEVSTLAAQYDGLTSSYNEWQKAQSATDERNMFEQISNNAEKVQDLIDSGWVSDQEVLAFTQMMTDEDLSSKSIEYILDMYEKGLPTIQKFFDGSTEGLGQFLDTAKEVSDELGKSWVQVDENGNYTFDFGVGGDKDLADAINQMTDLQMSTQQVQILLRALSDAGLDINLDSLYSSIESLERLKTEAEKANSTLLDLGKTDISFNFDETDIEKLNTDINKAKELLDQFKNSDGNVDLSIDGASESQIVLSALISQKQKLEEPSVMNIDSSNLSGELSNAIGLLQEYHNLYNGYEINIAVGADTSEAESDLQGVANKLNEVPDTVWTALGIDTSLFYRNLDEIRSTNVDVGVNLNTTSLNNIDSVIAGIDADKNVNLHPNTTDVDKETSKTDGGNRTTRYNADTSGLTNVQSSTYGGTRTVYYKPDTTAVDYASSQLALNPITIPVEYSKGTSNVDGTAWAKGTIAFPHGVAFTTGNWGTKDSGYALGGELGYEILVRDGKYQIIGENGASFFHYKKNDIIFNHEQSEQLLKQGKITRGKRTGKSFSGGTIEGLAFSSGNGKFSTVNLKSSDTDYTSNSNSSDSSSSFEDTSDNIEDATEAAKEFEETIDWIEIKIDRIERTISTLSQNAENVYKSWSSRNKNLRDEIKKITEEISIQSSAYDRYIQQANSVGLSESIAKDVRNGKIDITTIKDEDLANKIKDYRSWYEKAINARDAIVELNQSVSELYSNVFDNVQTRYESIFASIENRKNTLNEYISQVENRGYITSTKLYGKLAEQERTNISNLEKERIELTTAMNEAVNSKALTKGSEEWNRMNQEIQAVVLSIEESTTALTSYAKAIRSIKWEIFDTIEDRISTITTESDFLINLLSSENLYNSRGQFTNEGNATMALHASDYNVYMSQADDYAKEIAALNKGIADDSADNEAIERRNELLKLQQESILAAEQEKDAIKSMVKEGIELELESLQELIQERKDALDEEKNLYDYQKKVKDQTKEIKSLEKQLQAYSGDTSEETRTTIQKLKVSLESAKEDLQEIEYEKYISDQKQMLDNLYNDYETVLNKRLDDTNRLMNEMIQSVNSNAGTIASTIYNSAGSVGYTLSEGNKDIWGSAYESIKTDSDIRLSQMQETVNNLIGDNSISKEDGDAVLAAIKSGDVTNVEKTLNAINSLVEQGKITQPIANMLTANLTVEDVEKALKSLDLVTDLQKSGLITKENADEMITAITTGDKSISSSIGVVISKLLTDKKISFEEGGTILRAINGANVSGVVSGLSSIDTLLSNGIITKSESDTLIQGIVTGGNSDTKNIISRLLLNDTDSQNDAIKIQSAITHLPFAGLASAINGINTLQKDDVINKTQAEKLIESLLENENNKFKNILEKVNNNDSRYAYIFSSLTSLMQKEKDHDFNIATQYDTNFANDATSIKESTDKIKDGVNDIVKGDVNNDGILNVRDAAYIAQMISKGASSNVSLTGDMDGDGKITVRDSALIAQLLKNKGYAKGIKKINKNELSWTQEKGTEYIIRRSDGAILTPLTQNDSVLNAQASNNIWNMATDPEKFIKENISVNDKNLPSISNLSTINYSGGDIQITLPNVQSYQEFKYALQHDSNFESFMRSVTVDRIFGKSSLRKYNV